ncbi:MAG: alkaline phosphatase family protein [Candidatus Aminicenantes bacterium]|nr:alkaline phosphatase family protein [Candidatus Aminicenantes bacterium]
MAGTARFIFLFFDGVGLNPDHRANPFAAANCRFLPFHQPAPTLPDGTPVIPIDALLGVEGIPQSASGQATLYTGINIPARWGHRGSYPGPELRRVLYRDNLLKSLSNCGRSAIFFNAYPHYSRLFSPPHLELMPDGQFRFSVDFPQQFRRRLSTTTCMMLSSGMKPRNEEHIRQGSALYQEFSNQSLIRLGLDIPEYSPEQAADIIANNAATVDFLLFEYFQTDLFAHRKTFQECVDLVIRLDKLVGRLLEQMDPQRDTLILTSDHGNLEDCSLRTHTLNPVPLLAWGKNADDFRPRIRNLGDVTPVIRKLMGCSAGSSATLAENSAYLDSRQQELA